MEVHSLLETKKVVIELRDYNLQGLLGEFCDIAHELISIFSNEVQFENCIDEVKSFARSVLNIHLFHKKLLDGDLGVRVDSGSVELTDAERLALAKAKFKFTSTAVKARRKTR